MKTKELVRKYIKLESQLQKELNKLENGKGDCTCGNPEYIQFVAYDEIYQGTSDGYYIQSICLNCGGQEIEQ